MERAFILWFVGGLWFLATVAHAETPLPGEGSLPFRHLSIEQGLSQVSVDDVIQDRDGFLWVATQDGLDRYDGRSIVALHASRTNKASLTSNWITFVFEDSHGRLWVGTNGAGLNRKIATGFAPASIRVNGKVLHNARAKAMIEDHQGNLWLSVWGVGLCRFSPRTQVFEHCLTESRLREIWGFTLWQGQLLLALNGGGIAQISAQGTPTFPKFAASLEHVSVQALWGRGDTLYVGTEGAGLWSMKSGHRLSQLVPVPLPWLARTSVFRLLMDATGTLWIGTEGKGLVRRTAAGTWHHQTASDTAQGLSNNRILSLFQDRSGVVWVGTEGGGLNAYDPYGIDFNTLRKGPNPATDLNDKMIYSVAVDPHRGLWIGTEAGGINYWDGVKQRFRYFNQAGGQLESDTVRALLPTRDGVWVGTLKGLVLINRDGKVLRHYDRKNLPGLQHNAILALANASDGRIWIGSFAGLDLFDPGSSRIVKGYSSRRYGGPFDRAVVTDILVEPRQLWVTTWGGGLYVLDLQKNTWRSFKHDDTKADSIGGNALWSVYRSKKGVLWIGTDGAGLQALDESRGTFRHYDRNNGLANEVIYGILEGSAGHLWLSTNSGLSRLDPSNGTVQNYYTSDGLQGHEFNAGAFVQTKNRLFFGGVDGLNWFDIRPRQGNPHRPQTQFTDLRVMNQPVTAFADGVAFKLRSKGREASLTLDSAHNMFSVNFAALHFSGAKRNHFRYRMHGLEQTWINADADHGRATYAGLSPGQYQLEVYAISGDGIRDLSPEILNVEILPQIWRSHGAIALYSAILILLVAWYVRLNRRQLLAERELNRGLVKIDGLREQLAESERFAVLGELASNVAHSLRNPLASIRSSAELLEDDPTAGNDTRSGARNIIAAVDRLGTWVKELLDYARENRQISVAVDLVRETQDCVDSYSRRGDSDTAKIHFATECDDLWMYIDAGLYRHMLNNLLDNALEASKQNGKVEIKIWQEDNHRIHLSVTDKGIGMDAAQQAKIFEPHYTTKAHGLGMGLSLVKRIVDRQGGEISVSSGKSGGTEFEITFSADSDTENW